MNNKTIIEQAFDDMVGLGLLAPTERLNRNGNPVFVKTAMAFAMCDDAYADALEVALARRGPTGSMDVLVEEGGKPS